VPGLAKLEHRAATSCDIAAHRGAAEIGRAVEIARRIGDQAGEGFFPVAAGEAVEDIQGPRRRQLEDCAATRGLIAARIGAAQLGRAVEIARRVGDQAGVGICPVAGAAARERMEGSQLLRRGCAGKARDCDQSGAQQRRPAAPPRPPSLAPFRVHMRSLLQGIDAIAPKFVNPSTTGVRARARSDPAQHPAATSRLSRRAHEGLRHR
jgi:hypothetical protein